MLINKSMYPVQAGYSAISTMQSQLGKLQTQLGSGQKSQTLAEMGSDRTVSLATRNRLTKLDSFSANIDTVNLRLNFLDQAFTSLNKLKSETRTSATPTSYGENNLTMVSLQKDSQNRLSQLLETLNLSVAGRYLMGGNQTDKAPVATYDQIMYGEGTADGYLKVAEERRKADLGADTTDKLGNVGLPRSKVLGPWENKLVISSAEFERFGYKITSISGNTATTQTSGATADPLAPTVQMTAQPAPGDLITFNMTRRDGTTQTFAARAVAGAADPYADPPQYSIGGTVDQTAGNLEDLMGQRLGNLENFKVISSSNADVKVVSYTDGMSAVSITFDKQPADGEVVSIGVKDSEGNTRTFEFKAVTGPVTPGATPPEYLIGANRKETLANLQGLIKTEMGTLDAPIKLGRLTAGTNALDNKVVDIAEQVPTTSFGYKLSSASTTSSKINVSSAPASGGLPASVRVEFMGNPRAGESVTINLKMPDGTSTPIVLQAVDREPVTGQFVIGATAEETTANFEAALKLKLDQTSKTELVSASSYAAADDFFTTDGVARRLDLSGGIDPETATVFAAPNSRETVKWYRGEVGTTGDNPRLSATAQVDDSTKVGYGVRANETGLRELVKTLAAMSTQEYDINDTTSKARFSAMVERQMATTSSSTATNKGSIEQIGLELGVVRATTGGAASRNTAASGQLETLLSEVETVTMEETVMQLLALKTRLEASFQTTATVARLSLVNYLK